LSLCLAQRFIRFVALPRTAVHPLRPEQIYSQLYPQPCFGAAVASAGAAAGTAADTAADMASEKMMYVVRCPLGDECSKKGGILAKRENEEDAREAVKWHLTRSPYHEMNANDAEVFKLGCEVEQWPVWAADDDAGGEDENEWYQKRKKPRTGNAAGDDDAWDEDTDARPQERHPKRKQQHHEQQATAAALKLIAAAMQGTGGSAKGSGSSGSGGLPNQLALTEGPKGMGGKVEMPRQQLMACVDAMRRAKTAVESACMLCGKASRAFAEETVTIQNCLEVVESYLQ